MLTAEIDSGLVVNPLTLAEVLVSPTRSGLADRVLAVLADLEINEAPFPFDSATKLARLRADSGLRVLCPLLGRPRSRHGRGAPGDRAPLGLRLSLEVLFGMAAVAPMTDAALQAGSRRAPPDHDVGPGILTQGR